MRQVVRGGAAVEFQVVDESTGEPDTVHLELEDGYRISLQDVAFYVRPYFPHEAEVRFAGRPRRAFV